MLKRAIMGVSALALLAGAASAADLSGRYPVRSAPMVMPMQAFSWTGFYIGANVGWGWGSNSFNYSNSGIPFGTGMGGSNGGFIGLQGGYNFQFANNVVIGAEADFQFIDMGSSSTFFAEGGVLQNATSDVKTFGTIRGRLGYGIDRFLPYVTAGAAWANTKYEGPWGGSNDSISWGWTVGVGSEYALMNNLTIKAEYLYVDLGTADINYVGGATANFGVDMNILKVGANYKF